MKHLKVKINIPIYFGRLIIIFSNNINKANKYFKIKPEFDIAGFHAVCIQKTKKGITNYYILLPKKVKAKVIAHEAVHALNYIYKDRHIGLDVENDEPQAYLTGWIVGEVFEAAKKFKIKIV